MAGIGTSEILIILLVVLLLFGSAKLPDLARSLGRSARILKAETKGLRADDDNDRPARPADAQPEQASSQPYQAPQQRQLPPGGGDGATINGVPLSDSERARRSS